MKRTITSLLLSVLLSGALLNGQDFDFSQWYNNPTYYNPAYVGLTPGFKARFSYRRQMVKIPSNFKTYAFSADIAERSLPGAGGIGIIIDNFNASQGMVNHTIAGIMPSVRVPIAEYMVMQMGVQAAFVQKRINWDNLIFPDQLDPRYGNIYPTSFIAPNSDKVTYPDFTAGLLFQFKGNGVSGVVGGAMHHLTRPNESFYEGSAPLPRKYVAHLDLIWEFQQNKGFYRRSSSFKINPGFFYQNQATLSTFSFGSNFYFTNVYLGIWYKNESFEYDTYSTFSLMGGINIPFADVSRLKLMYSYDFVIYPEYTFTGPTHELTLIFEFDDISLFQSRSVSTARYRGGRDAMECSPF
jgi:type IX secretion system PorP/SprF family membrane protein